MFNVNLDGRIMRTSKNFSFALEIVFIFRKI